MLMAYKGVFLIDDNTMFRVMELASRTGALAMIHGENGEVIDVLVKEAVAAGNLDYSSQIDGDDYFWLDANYIGQDLPIP